MKYPSRVSALVAALALVWSFAASADEPALMQVTPQMLETPKTYPAPGFAAEGAEALFYDSVPWREKPTRVFAWLGIPKTEPGKKLPGMVLIHGGGGTAFASWVKRWVSRGYAAIAMDTCGTVPRGTYGKWERHEMGGPPHNAVTTANEPITDQWAYHAVSAAILGHSLLRSRPEVDVDRIGVTGISWGGYLTCVVSGLDQRLKFAVPVYGCGYLGDNSLLEGALAQAGPTGVRWLALWDPSHYLPAGKMPKLWVNGTNDFAFPMNAMQKSYRIAGGEQTLCIRLRMPHGHGEAGEGPEEIHAFANSILKGGKPLAKVVATAREGDKVTATFQSDVPLVKAELLFTKATGRWQDRLWEAIPAQLDSNGKVTATLPEGTTVYYLNVEDERKCVVSTEHAEVGK